VRKVQFDTVRLDTEVQELSGVHVVRVAGEIDVYTSPELKSALNKAITSGAVNLVVDLTAVDYMDSSGFGTLLGATKRVRPKGGTINLVGCSEAVARMLTITRLNTIFGVFSSLDDALKSMSP
jgi:anti-sigma B factor antagonist